MKPQWVFWALTRKRRGRWNWHANSTPRPANKAGSLKLDELITRRYSIDEAPQAFDDLIHGRYARGVIVF